MSSYTHRTQFVACDPGSGTSLEAALNEAMEKLSPRIKITAISPVTDNGKTVGAILTTQLKKGHKSGEDH